MPSLNITKEQIEKAIYNTKTMKEAASNLGRNFKTFRFYAIKYNLYTPNPAGKGIHKNKPVKHLLKDILKGRVPNFKTFHLKNRIIKELQWKLICNKCQLSQWNNKPIPLELEHINGNPKDHRKKNLILLCPNCHAQTPTYRGKNISKSK
jgi:hypothetical protein